ncbi:MAG: OmpA family protein [Bacteroidales bacterium]|nr:OmpA family protein [Bacteroidales bacterium]
MTKNLFIILIFISTISLFSCVPLKQYKDLKSKNEQCEDERGYLKNQNKELSEKITELQTLIDKLNKQINELNLDTASKGYAMRTQTEQLTRMTKLNEELNNLLKKKNFENTSENQKLLTQLQQLQESLLKKEDELKAMEREINKKKYNVDSLLAELNSKTELLEKKNARLIELEGILNKKDSAVLTLKEKVAKALKGYEGNGLTVTNKNGKVYVSMEEKLLFQSGKWEVDAKGQKAIKDLAAVLEKNNDVNIMIEGHTDDVPFKGNGAVEDNWDLSTKRATAVLKILLNNSKIDPKRLSAVGRGEYLPLENAKTAEARAKNRRTEIILTPKLDELFKILEAN